MADIHDSGVQAAANEVNAGYTGPGAVQNFINAYVNFDNELSQVTWPSVAQTDVRTLLADDQKVISLIQPVLTNPENLDLTALDAAKAAAKLAENQVRIDLGVPIP
jgi:hypothetical protein